ncbi:hypothetical protein HMPREF3113_17015 [Stenotrophomonas sp. HMSC10F06]|nr:hypothetical protein HMPREF3113_17015 [Stenotrophomonas sp. HMSC10F06]
MAGGAFLAGRRILAVARDGIGRDSHRQVIGCVIGHGHAGAAVFGVLVVMFGALLAGDRGGGVAQGIAGHGSSPVAVQPTTARGG